ncbi:MAG: sigma-70 family RNA polymerase sigma factor, partial [Chloroflexi bacterium]|nr:sigma-70 family RNA polymerase sigma factor [Chloroflexota bacterium]
CIRGYQRKRRVAETPLSLARPAIAETASVEESVVRDEERASVRRAMDRLTHEQRELLALRYFAELTVPEIARVMGRREGTIKSRLSRTLGRMRELLEEDEGSWKTRT